MPILITFRPNPSTLSSRTTADLHQPQPVRATAAVCRRPLGHRTDPNGRNLTILSDFRTENSSGRGHQGNAIVAERHAEAAQLVGARAQRLCTPRRGSERRLSVSAPPLRPSILRISLCGQIDFLMPGFVTLVSLFAARRGLRSWCCCDADGGGSAAHSPSAGGPIKPFPPWLQPYYFEIVAAMVVFLLVLLPAATWLQLYCADSKVCYPGA